MRKKLLNIFNKFPEKFFRQKEIIHRMKMKQHEIGAVKILLNALVKSGEITQIKGIDIHFPENEIYLKVISPYPKRDLDLSLPMTIQKIFLLAVVPWPMPFMVIVYR